MKQSPSTIVRVAGRRVRVLVLALVVGACLVAVVVAPAAAAPVRDPIWTTTVNGDGGFYDAATALAVSGAGTLYSTGYEYNVATGDDITVARWDDRPDGWSRVWDGDAHGADVGADMAVRGDVVYVVGSTQTAAGDSDMLILKYSSGGDVLWFETWGGAGASWEFANRIAIDRDGTVVMAGTRRPSPAAGPVTVVVVKYAPDGDRLWARSFARAGSNVSMADLCLDRAGNVYVVGSSTGGGHSDGFVVSFSPAGARRWARFYDGPAHRTDKFAAVCRCPLGGVYVVGRAGAAHAASDALVVRYTAAGARVLTRFIGVGDGRRQWLNDVAVDKRGRIAVCGGWERPDPDFYVALLKPSGALRWSHAYDNYANRDEALSLVIDSSDRVCAAGDIDVDPGIKQVGVYAFSLAGALRWYCRWPEPAVGAEDVREIARWQSSNVWVCGSGYVGPATGEDQVLLGWGL